MEETKAGLPAPTIFFFFEGERNIIFSLRYGLKSGVGGAWMMAR
jgi:hypothetical protein